MASKTGHALVKAAMRNVGAIYGGEISAHHYFRDFGFCDSGMIPWLMVWQLLSEKNQQIFELISVRKRCFPSSEELNFEVSDAANCMQIIKDLFVQRHCLWTLDGLSVTFAKWRFNQVSNTEPLVRLNIETRGDQFLLKEKTKKMTNYKSYS